MENGMRPRREKERYLSISRSIAALLCLLVTQNDSSPFADETSMTAVELLTAFSGESAKQYEPFFQFSEETRIVGVEIHAVGTESTTARYSGREEARKEVNNILRITTVDGFEGISGVDSYYQGQFCEEHLLELQDVAAELIGLQSLDPVEVGSMLERTRPDLSDAVRSNIDIALWDLAARKADRPLYELLGAKRDSMEPYASLPFFDSLPEYVEAVYQYAKLGYTTFKFHVWGSIEEDVRLVELVQQTFADSHYRFMIDLEGAYDLEDALRLGGQMDEGLFVWLEGPIDDELLVQYGELRSRLAIQIIPAGYSIYSPEFIRQGIEAGSWDAGRFDATTVGGITKALELLMIANDAGMSIEIQSWGHSLAQAANLHLMLANERTRYFEAPMPKEAFEFGMKNGNLLDRGRVVAPNGPGLGISVDWDRLATADFHVYSKLDLSASPGKPVQY
ncbi:MAG: mandelate racemase/muconate lactonizing enzyme family protein [Planctomycetes bacterium]|nr:mandelate racemase/muconate lactonizing enzyme family protein [Planctomycetota bacterium]